MEKEADRLMTNESRFINKNMKSHMFAAKYLRAEKYTDPILEMYDLNAIVGEGITSINSNFICYLCV